MSQSWQSRAGAIVERAHEFSSRPWNQARAFRFQLFDAGPPVDDSDTSLLDSARRRIAEEWASGDAWSAAVDILGEIRSDEPAKHLAVRWLARTRDAATSDIPWPPTDLGGIGSSTLAWLSAFVLRERGEDLVRVEAAIQEAGSLPSGADENAELQLAIVELVYRLRRIEETPPFSAIVAACKADHLARTGDLSAANAAFAQIAVQTQVEFPDHARDAALSAWRCQSISDAPLDMPSEIRAQLHSSAHAARERALSEIFRQLAIFDADDDENEVFEPFGVLTSIWFGDALVGALYAQREVAGTKSRIFARMKRWSMAIDSALDVVERSDASSTIFNNREEIPDSERIDALPKWRRWRDRSDGAAAYAELAQLFVPLLADSPSHDDVARLIDLAESGTASFKTNQDAARAAAVSLSMLGGASNESTGRRIADAMVRIVGDPEADQLRRQAALECLARYWSGSTPHSNSDDDAEWAIGTIRTFVDALRSSNDRYDWRWVAAVTQFGVRGLQQHAGHREASALANELLAAGENAQRDEESRERYRLAIGSELLRFLTDDASTSLAEGISALLAALRATASTGPAGFGRGVPIGIYDPVFSAANVARASTTHRHEMVSSLVAYATDANLSPAHRGRALDALAGTLDIAEVVASTANEIRERRLHLCLAEPLSPQLSPFDPPAGRLQATSTLIASFVASNLTPEELEMWTAYAQASVQLVGREASDILAIALGRLSRHVSVDRSTIIALKLFALAQSESTRLSSAPWVGLLFAIRRNLPEDVREALEGELVAFLKSTIPPWWMRRDLIGHAAIQVRTNEIEISTTILRQLVAVGTSDAFGPVRKAGRNLAMAIERGNVNAPVVHPDER